MTTKLIGVKDFRQNLAAYAEEIQKSQMRFIIIKKNVPILEIKSIDEKEFALEKLKKDIKQSRIQAKKGKVYTQEKIMREFGIL